MRAQLSTEYLFAALGLFGVGAPMIWPDQVWIGWAFVGLAILTIVFGVRFEGSHVHYGGPKWRSRVNWYFVVAAVGGLVCVTALVGYYVDQAKGPILWDFDASKPPLGVSRSSAGPLWIDAIQITGQSRSDDPIVVREAFVRSDLTARTMRLQFAINGVLVPLNQATIIPQGQFILISVFPSTDPAHSQGIIADAFRAEFERFTFVFDYGEGRRYTRRFSEKEVDRFLAKADVETRNALNRPMPGAVGTGAVRNPQ